MSNDFLHILIYTVTVSMRAKYSIERQLNGSNWRLGIMYTGQNGKMKGKRENMRSRVRKRKAGQFAKLKICTSFCLNDNS